jgi:hypothetical protein|tara:strand:+ start:271 stop:414 length:144 start_codon:yes stop_codon:yes gene_type:complete
LFALSVNTKNRLAKAANWKNARNVVLSSPNGKKKYGKRRRMRKFVAA